MSEPPWRVFRFFGLIHPREGALHLHMVLPHPAIPGGPRVTVQADQVLIETPRINLEEMPFDHLAASVSALAESFSLVLSLITRQPYRIDLTSWQEVDAETGRLVQPGIFLPPQVAVGKLELAPLDMQIISIEQLANDPALREALLDYRTAMENRMDALVFLWRAIEGLHEAVITVSGSTSKDFSISDQRLSLPQGTLKSLFDKANQPQFRQRHAKGARTLLNEQELQEYFRHTRDVVVAYARATKQEATSS